MVDLRKNVTNHFVSSLKDKAKQAVGIDSTESAASIN